MHKRTHFFFVLLSILFTKVEVDAQVICIYCEDKNDAYTPAAPNLLLNGSFEANDCSPGDYICPSSGSYNCDIPSWTVIDGGGSTYATILDNGYTIVPEGNEAVYLGNAFCKPCSQTNGDVSCLNFLECVVEGLPAGYPINTFEYGDVNGVSILQTVNGLTIGSIYVLEFWAGGEDGFTGGPGVFGVDLGFGYHMLSCEQTPPNPGIIGRRYLIEFKAISTSHTIKFTNWGHVSPTSTELILDDVKLYTIENASPDVEVCLTGYVPIPVDIFSIPNVFSPNDDDINETFEIHYSGDAPYTLEILNRWGERMFMSEDKTKHWDGTFDGKEAAEGTYFYKLNIGNDSYSGFLNLVR